MPKRIGSFESSGGVNGNAPVTMMPESLEEHDDVLDASDTELEAEELHEDDDEESLALGESAILIHAVVVVVVVVFCWGGVVAVAGK
jgi:hypothetical protein